MIDRARHIVLRRGLPLALLVLAGAIVDPALAQETGFTAKVAGVYVDASADDDNFGTDVGLGVGVEYRLSRRLGLELGLITSELSRTESLGGDPPSGTIRFDLRSTPVLARLNLHLTPDAPVDVYAGPVVGHVFNDDLDVAVRGEILGAPADFSVPIEDAFTYGAHLGIDLPVGDRGFFVNAGATYLISEIDADVEPGGADSFDLDLLLAHAGFGFRF